VLGEDLFPDPDGDYISPSQIESWRLCRRKWAWNKIDKIQGLGNVAAEKGTIIHEVLEAWLKDGRAIDPDEVRTLSDGTMFKPGPIAAAGLKHLPMPKTCGTERFIHVKTQKAKYHGYIDWDLKGDVPVVGDHKSTSDFKWAKTEDDLRKDPQATIYAAAIMAETGAVQVELRWVYYQTKGAAKSKKVSLVVLKEDVERNFDELDVTALEINEARRTAKTALDLEPNVRACDNFGGCQYRENCNLSSTDRIKGLMAQESLAEKMEKRKHGIETNEKETDMETLAEKMKRRAAESAGKTPAPVNGASASGGAEKMAGATLGKGINPPEGSTTREAVPLALVPPAGEAVAVPPAARKNRLSRPAAVGATPAGTLATGPVVPTSTAPVAGATTDASARAGITVIAVAKLGMVPFTLYVNCVPSKFKGLIMCVNTQTPEGVAALGVLESLATDVVRAIG